MARRAPAAGRAGSKEATGRTDRAKLDYVDCARGIAILMVILVHANQPVEGLSPIAHTLASYGQTGVQLFFIASAFTLCLTYARHDSAPHRYAAFLVRRVFRIAPLYLVGVVLYLLMHWLGQADAPGSMPTFSAPVLSAPYTPLNVLANVTFLHGFVPSANNSIVPGGWSIGTEMAFYVCFPALFMAFARLQRLGDGWLLAATGASVVISVAAQWWLHDRMGVDIGNNSFMFYNLLNQLPVFLLGLCYYYLREPYGPRFWPSGRLAGGFLLGTAGAFLLWDSSLAIAFALLPVVCGASFVCLLALLARVPWRGRWLQSIGQVSFSMYIVHFVVCWYGLAALKAIAPIGVAPETLWIAGFALVTAVSYALARVSQRLIEARGIALGNRLIAAWHGAASVPAASGAAAPLAPYPSPHPPIATGGATTSATTSATATAATSATTWDTATATPTPTPPKTRLAARYPVRSYTLR